MRLKTNLVISVIFLGLLGFVYFYEIRGGQERQEAAGKARQLLAFSDHEVRRLSIDRGDTLVSAEKADGGWRLTWPVQTDADGSAIERYLRNLRETEVEGEPVADSATVVGDRAVPARYGLDTPRLRVLLEVAGDGARADTVRFGDDTPTDRFTYAQRSGTNPEVFRVRAWRYDNFNKGLFDLRDRRVLAFEPSEVKSLRLARPGEPAIDAVREGGHWRLEAPLQRPADDAAVDGILSRLKGAEATAVVHESPSASQLEQTGLSAGRERVALTLWVGDDRAEKRLLVGAETEHGDRHARDSSRPQVFVVDSTVVEPLLKPLADLRDRHPFRVDANAVTSLALLRGGSQLLRAERDTSGAWSVPGLAGREAKTWRLNSLVTDLDALEVKEFVADAAGVGGLQAAAFGLDAPRYAIAVELRDGRSWELRVGRPADTGVYAMRADLPSVVRLDAAAVGNLDVDLDDVTTAVEPPAGAGAQDVAAGASD